MLFEIKDMINNVKRCNRIKSISLRMPFNTHEMNVSNEIKFCHEFMCWQ